MSRSLDYIKGNIWTVATIVIISIMSVMIGRNVIHAISIGFDIGRLEQQREEYQYQITRDSSLLESLSNDDELIKYAREKFYMQSSKEEIFIIE